MAEGEAVSGRRIAGIVAVIVLVLAAGIDGYFVADWYQSRDGDSFQTVELAETTTTTPPPKWFSFDSTALSGMLPCVPVVESSAESVSGYSVPYTGWSCTSPWDTGVGLYDVSELVATGGYDFNAALDGVVGRFESSFGMADPTVTSGLEGVDPLREARAESAIKMAVLHVVAHGNWILVVVGVNTPADPAFPEFPAFADVLRQLHWKV